MSTLEGMLRRRDIDGVVRAIEPLIRRELAGLYVRGADPDDLLQEGRLGAVEAARDWRPGRASFEAFAAMCVRRRAVSAVRAGQRLKHGPVLDSDRLDAPLSDVDGGTLLDVLPSRTFEPLDLVLARDALRHRVAAVQRMSPLEAEVTRRVLVAGESYVNVAAALDVAEKSVDNAVQRARHRMRHPDAPRHPVVGVARRLAYAERDVAVRRGADAARACAATRLPGERVVECVPRALGPDGDERADTRGRPAADGRRPRAVWRLTLARTVRDQPDP